MTDCINYKPRQQIHINVHNKTVLIADVIAAACEMSGVSYVDMIGPSRLRCFASWRQKAMAVAYDICGQSYPVIGRYFGGRDHTTVLYAHRKIMASEALAYECVWLAERACEIADERAVARRVA